MHVTSRSLFHPALLDLFKKPYQLKDFRADVLAGITVGFVALPVAIGLSVASIPQGTQTPYPAPAIGIFTALIGGFLVAVFGGTRFQVAGPAATMIPISILIIQQYGFGGLLIATFFSGVLLTILGFLKLGSFMKYLPWSVVSGFTTGIAISIVIDEIGDFLGISTIQPKPYPFLDKIHFFCNYFHTFTPSSIVIGLTTFAIIYLWRKIGYKQIPGMIVALVLVTVLASLPFFQKLGPIITLGSNFGANVIPSHLPSLLLPTIKIHELPNLFIAGLAILIVCSVESLLAAVISDRLTDSNHDRNTELIAQGISNMASPFFGGLPSTGMIARTSLNVKSGARSPISALIHSLTLLLIIVFFTNYVTFIPMAVVAGILMSVAIEIGEWSDLKRLFEIPLSDCCILLMALLLTVFFDIIVALEASMLFAAMIFIKRITETTEISYITNQDPLGSFRVEPIPEGVLICNIQGPLLFGAAEKMEHVLEKKQPLPKIVIFNLELVSIMDATALNVLEIIAKKIHQSEGNCILSGTNRKNIALLQRAKFTELIGKKNFCKTLEESMERSLELLADQQPFSTGTAEA
ncbi:MAG: SulP family inorganic anion transporter [Chthoniobacterales bacterium]